MRVPGSRRPDEVIVEGGLRGIGRLGLGRKVAGLSLDAVGETMLGARRNTHSGKVTMSLSGGGAGWALLGALTAGPTGASDRQVVARADARPPSPPDGAVADPDRDARPPVRRSPAPSPARCA